MGPTKEAFAARKHRSLICATCLLTARETAAFEFERERAPPCIFCCSLKSNNAETHREKEQYFLIWTPACVCVCCVFTQENHKTLLELFFSTPLLRAQGDSGRTLYGSNYSTNLYSTCAPTKVGLWHPLLLALETKSKRGGVFKICILTCAFIKQLIKHVYNNFALSQTCSRKVTFHAGINWGNILKQRQLGITFFPEQFRYYELNFSRAKHSWTTLSHILGLMWNISQQNCLKMYMDTEEQIQSQNFKLLHLQIDQEVCAWSCPSTC